MVDGAVDAVCGSADKAVLAVVDFCEASTEYCPPVETVPVVLPSVHVSCDAPEVDSALPGLRSPVSPGSSNEPPDDFTVDGSLAVQSASETADSVFDPVSEENSPIGPSLLDSDDELIASRLPGYLSSFF